MDKVDPKIYNLPPRTVLLKDSHNNFILFMDRKSRIIMKDAFAILEKAEKIKNIAPDATIALETSAPVCSKSIKLLNNNDINVVSKK